MNCTSGAGIQELEKLARMAHFHPGELSVLWGVPPRRLHRQFIRVFGLSPSDWLNDQRKRSIGLLFAGGEPLKAIAAEVGFSHSSSFCRWLRSVESVSVTGNSRRDHPGSNKALWVVEGPPSRDSV